MDNKETKLEMQDQEDQYPDQEEQVQKEGKHELKWKRWKAI